MLQLNISGVIRGGGSCPWAQQARGARNSITENIFVNNTTKVSLLNERKVADRNQIFAVLVANLFRHNSYFIAWHAWHLTFTPRAPPRFYFFTSPSSAR